MSVRKRNTGIGIRWYVDILLPNGRRFRKVVGSKKQADQVHRNMEAEIVSGKWELRESEEIRFCDLVDEYLDYAMGSKAKSFKI